ncbi:hypothetical protein [Niveispirillum sp. KHB5.9]|uniref:hypothetical protein n=1 Tax=Niveispirillum sp. KHB5.9 TaxID=3400269 RepID=UPI003A8BDF77
MKPEPVRPGMLDVRTIAEVPRVAAAQDPAVEMASRVLGDFARLLMAARLPEEAVPATRFLP